MGTQRFSVSASLEKSGQEGGFLLQWCVIGEGGYGCYCLYRLALGLGKIDDQQMSFLA